MKQKKQEGYDDQIATLESDSKKVGTRQGEMDFALLLDGLRVPKSRWSN